MSSGYRNSSNQNGRDSFAEKSNLASSLPLQMNISPIPVSTDTPRDSGRTSPDSIVTPHNSTLKDDGGVPFDSSNDEALLAYRDEIRLLRRQIEQLKRTADNQVDKSTNELRRKVASIESDHADKLRAFNEETIKLHSEIAKLRASVERGEVVKQKLEYELALARKAANQEKRVAAERESTLHKTNAGLKDSLAQLQKQLKDAENSLETFKKKNSKDEKAFRLELSGKENVIEHLKQQIKYAEEEKDKLHNVIQEQESMYSEMEDKCNALEIQRSSQSETIHKQMKDLEFASDREERLKKEIEHHQERVKSLEESIEAERAAHLETKFNSEIVQLRVRDLEGALEVEKSALEEARQNMEIITQQKRDVEAALESQKDLCNSEKDKVTKMKEDLEIQKRNFSEDLEEKQQIISKLSKQLEVHEKNFEALKGELSQAKKRQIHLDTTYGSSMRELELLLQNFQAKKPDPQKKSTTGISSNSSLELTIRNLKCSGLNTAFQKMTRIPAYLAVVTESTDQRKENTKQPSPALILENLRHTLLDYQNRCSSASLELGRLQKVMENLTSECERYKEMVISRDKAMKETQNALAATKKELAKVSSDRAEKEAVAAALNVDMKRLQKTLDELNVKFKDAEEQNMKLKNAYSEVDEGRCRFLHTLYQRMITGQVYITSPDSMISNYTWADMSSLLAEQVAAHVHELHRVKERNEHLERIINSKEDELLNIRESREQTVSKLSSALKDREKSWKKQKTELENHYTKLIDDLHSRTQKTQTLADEALENVQRTGQAKETLEQENIRLQQALQQSHRHKGSLLSSCALLAGALWPAFIRIRSLASQRNILSEYVNCLEILRQKTRTLSEMLNSEMDEKDKEKQLQSYHHGRTLLENGRRPILLFRVGVIVVLAANRIQHFSSVSSKLFVSTECPGEIGGLSVVLCGGFGKISKPFKGLAKTRRDSYNSKPHDRACVLNVRSWLTSSHLEDDVVSSLVELQQMLCHTSGSSSSLYSEDRDAEEFSRVQSPPSQATIVGAAKSAYSKLISRLQAEFSTSSGHEDALWRDGFNSYRNDLIFQLGQGLQKYITETIQYTSSQVIVSNLQNHILSFTQRLHSAEVDRRGLRIELSKAKQECSELKSAHLTGQEDTRKARDGLRTTEERLHDLREEMLTMIPVSRFEHVCEELNNALKREQQAQALLNEQTAQMQEMGARLDLHNTQGEEKDATLDEAIKGLSEAKMQLRRQEHAVRQMTKQTAHLENEKRMMTDRLSDADKALRANAREKEALLNYLRSVEKALEQSIEQVRLSQGAVGAYELTLPNLILPNERLALEGSTMGPEMLACQNVVQVFVEAQQEALDRISSLESEKQQALSRLGVVEKEIASHKTHIVRLKDELQAACRRQMSEDGMSDDGKFAALDGFAVNNLTSRKFPEYHSDDSYKNEFVALSAHRDSSAASLRPSFAPAGTDKNKTLFSSPKRRSSSSYRRQSRKAEQDFNMFLSQEP